MELPLCPSCQRGHLLPMSAMNQTYSYSVCSSPDCTYVVSTSPRRVLFFKGEAVPKPQRRGEKECMGFEF